MDPIILMALSLLGNAIFSGDPQQALAQGENVDPNALSPREEEGISSEQQEAIVQAIANMIQNQREMQPIDLIPGASGSGLEQALLRNDNTNAGF